MDGSHARRFILMSIGLCATTGAAAQATERWEVGVRAGIVVANGEPANDITYGGLVLKYALSPDTLVGLSIDRQEFDFERPWALLGLQQDTVAAPEDIDSKATATLFRAFYERRYGAPAGRWRWYWNVGLGFAKPEVPTVSGPVAGGGTFVIRTEPGTEWVPSVGAGLLWQLSTRASVDLGATIDHHIADWKVTDTVSGRTAKVKSYTAGGLQIGLSVRF
jgi:hypothetical protein